MGRPILKAETAFKKWVVMKHNFWNSHMFYNAATANQWYARAHQATFCFKEIFCQNVHMYQ